MHPHGRIFDLCPPDGLGLRHERSAMAAANTPATRMATAFVKFTSILWKGSGHCCAPGCARTAAFPRRSCPSIWASFNSSTIPASAAKPCSVPSLPPWSHDQTSITPEPRKSQNRFRPSAGRSGGRVRGPGFRWSCPRDRRRSRTHRPRRRAAPSSSMDLAGVNAILAGQFANRP